MHNQRLVLVERPRGRVNEQTTRLDVEEVDPLRDGEARIRVGMLSIDPTIRTWMDDAPGYLPPIGIGEVIRGSGVGEVVETRSDRYQVGDVVYGMTGWQEFATASGDNHFTVVPRGLGVDVATMMNILGVTGITAYFGLLEVGRFKEGDVVVVSGAAGATGSVVGQLARSRGARQVVGIAGGPDKCREVVEEYGFDDCLDYRDSGFPARLREVCPSGIDLYFDNVGGVILDTAIANLAMRGRVVLCGAISQYNAESRYGVQNSSMLIVRRGSVEGFIVLDYASRFSEAQIALAGLVASGEIKHREHVVRGLERAPEALNHLFDGVNHGKTLVEVDGTVTLG